MARRIPTDDARSRAVVLAVTALVEKYGGQNAAAKKTELKQPHISKVLLTGHVGIEFADRVAAIYDTTVDGLVAEFLGGNNPVKAANIRGWQRAVEEARAEHGADLPWELAGDIVLPVRPAYATKAFALALVRVLTDFASASRVRIPAQKAAP